MKINFTFVVTVIVIILCFNSVNAQETMADKHSNYLSDGDRTRLELDALNPLRYVDQGTEYVSSRINEWLSQLILETKYNELGTNVLRVYGRIRNRWQEQGNFDFDEDTYDLQHFQHHFFRFGVTAITTEFQIDFELNDALESASTRLYGEQDEDYWDIHRLTFMLTGFQGAKLRINSPFKNWDWILNLMAYIGRGPITLGRGRLIGSNDWLNSGDTFDEIVMTGILEDSGTAITCFGLRDVVYGSGVNDSEYGTEVWGVGIIGMDPFNQIDDASSIKDRALLRPGHYDFEFFPVNNSKEHRSMLGIDAYVLNIYRDRFDIESELGRVGNYNINNIGLRAGFELVTNWIFEVEGNYQFGRYGNSNMRAFAFHTELNGGFNGFIPVSFTAAVGYASGDSDSKDGVVETFYDLFGNTNPRFGSIDMLGWRNLINFSFDMRIQIGNSILLKGSAHLFESAQGEDAVYGKDGTILIARGVGEPFKTIGYAFNAEMQCHYSKRIHLFAGMSYFKPGTRLKSVLLDDFAVQYYLVTEIRY